MKLHPVPKPTITYHLIQKNRPNDSLQWRVTQMHLQNNKSLFSYQSPSTLKSQVIKGHILTSQEAHNIKIYNPLHCNQGNLKSLMNHQGPTTFLYLTFRLKHKK